MYRPRRDLRILPDDIFLVSFPKSGNTWTRFLIANLVFPELTRRFREHSPAGARSVRDLRSGISTGCLVRASSRATNASIRATRERCTSCAIRATLLSRNITIIASATRSKTAIRWSKFVTRFLAGDTCPHGSWGENVTTWLTSRHNDPRFLLLRYEDMVADPQREMTRVAAFLNIPADARTRLASCRTQRGRSHAQTGKGAERSRVRSPRIRAKTCPSSAPPSLADGETSCRRTSSAKIEGEVGTHHDVPRLPTGHPRREQRGAGTGRLYAERTTMIWGLKRDRQVRAGDGHRRPEFSGLSR